MQFCSSHTAKRSRMERTRLVLSPSKVAMGRSDDLSGLVLQTCTESVFVDVDACELKCEVKVCR